MITIFLTLLKSYWKAILPIIFIGLAYWYVSSLKNDRDHWKSSYEAVILDYQAEAKIRVNENARKEQESKIRADKAESEHNKQLAALFVDGQKQRDKLKSELDSYYAKDKLNRFRLGAYADRLQLDASSNSTARSETASETEYPQASRECDGISAYARTLERGCAVTTSDLNLCSQWIEDLCELWSCGK
jgi:hypothetical protein